MSSDAQNIQPEPDALGYIENEFGRQNMKTRPDALSTVENDSGSAKHVNRTQRPWYRPK
jgi:hypothetical protein